MRSNIVVLRFEGIIGRKGFRVLTGEGTFKSAKVLWFNFTNRTNSTQGGRDTPYQSCFSGSVFGTRFFLRPFFHVLKESAATSVLPNADNVLHSSQHCVELLPKPMSCNWFRFIFQQSWVELFSWPISALDCGVLADCVSTTDGKMVVNSLSDCEHPSLS